MELIPGLPNDVARRCLLRLWYRTMAVALSVCKAWKMEIESPEFQDERKAAGYRDVYVVLENQEGLDPYRLSVFELSSRQWFTLPPIPGFPTGLPQDFELVAVKSDVLVLGGSNPDTGDELNSLYIYNVQSSEWRRGADMPGGIRRSYSCASDDDHMVYVAGGRHLGQEGKLKSAMAYDVRTDEWIMMPDMAVERVECKGAFQSGKFHVIGGSETIWKLEGEFITKEDYIKSEETFDPLEWSWGPVRANDLEVSLQTVNNCVGGQDGFLYMCEDNKLIRARPSSAWQVFADVPFDYFIGEFVVRFHDKLMIVGINWFEQCTDAYLLDLDTDLWTHIEVPGNIGGVFGVCSMEI